MAKRLFDLLGASLLLMVTAPCVLGAAMAIRLSSSGPAFYKAKRVGLRGRTFWIYKLRTMHVDRSPSASPITAARDHRVFRVGRWLRFLKLDELPQLFNILRGDMSFVGPRPEDPRIVRAHYGVIGMRTLEVRPGLAGVSSIFNYTHGDQWLDCEQPAKAYVEELLPVKLALELVYLSRVSFWYDLALIGRTMAVILLKTLGKQDFPLPPEWAELPRQTRSTARAA